MLSLETWEMSASPFVQAEVVVLEVPGESSFIMKNINSDEFIY
jgi:hypothetical protein